MIKFVVDSTAALTKEQQARYDITILPLRILLGDDSYQDGVDLFLPQLYEKMRRGAEPKTAQVSMEAFYEAFVGLLSQGHDVIYLAFSAVLSGTCNAARLVAEELQKQYPERRIAVIDGRGGAYGTGLNVLAGARLAAAGYSFDDVAAQMDFLANHVEHILALDDLTWINKGGRLFKSLAAAGNRLNIKPILELNDGYIRATRVVRGTKKLFETLADMTVELSKAFPEQIIGLNYTGDDTPPPAIYEMKQILLDRGLADRFVLAPVGCVLGIHLGLGGIGICFFTAKPPVYIPGEE